MPCPNLIQLLFLGAIAPRLVAADDGDDFSNNLFTDLAPLLALFGEKVTMEFFSQSMGWADCILLAMAPLGIVPIIVSAIRVGGPTFLRAIIGRARENLVSAEMEIMPSTSNESCELYNGADVVKCQGTAPIWEFICLIPPQMSRKDEAGRKYPKATIVTLHDAAKSDAGMLEASGASPWSYLRRHLSKSSETPMSSSGVAPGNANQTEARAPASADPNAASSKQPRTSDASSPSKRGPSRWFCWLKPKSAASSDPEQGQAPGATKLEPDSSDTPSQAVQNPEVGSQASGDAVSLASHATPHQTIRNPETSSQAGGNPVSAGPQTNSQTAQHPQTGQQTGSATAAVHSQASSASTAVPELGITIIRNTDVDAPNVSLNRPKNSERGELYVAALLGIIVQLAVVTWFGLISYYPPWRFQKGGEPVVWHAPPLTLAGTVVLAFGMLLCARIVDKSTKEKTYRPVGGQRARLVWLQQETTVSDQVFGSLALSPPHPSGAITFSSRAVEDKLREGKNVSKAAKFTVRECKTILGVFVSLAGFVIQFVGIRGMHWSASIAQLIAIFVMSAIRAWVRRIYTDDIRPHGLIPLYELDFLAVSLGDLNWAPWCDLSDDDSKSPGAPQDTNASEPLWHVVTGEKIASEGSLSPMSSPPSSRQKASGGLEVSNRYEAQGVLTMRRDLGLLADWRGPATREAARLTEAIESVMNNLFSPRNDHIASVDHLAWPLKVNRGGPQTEEIHLRLSWDSSSGAWRAHADELEATLSLWLYSAARASELQSSEDDEESKGLSSDDDSWLRGKDLRSRPALRQLGPCTPELLRDLRWWLPRDVLSVVKARRTQGGIATANTRIVEIEEDRVVGFGRTRTSLSTTQPATAQPSEPSQTIAQQNTFHQTNTSDSRRRVSAWEISNANLTDAVDEDNSVSASTQAEYVLATMSHEGLQQLYAKDLFNAFIWAAADLIQGTIDEQCETQPQGDKGVDSWKYFTLRSKRLTKLAQDVQDSQLMTLEEAYLSIIPPLSGRKKLPELYGLIETAREKGRECERRQLWTRACSIYVWLWGIAKTFPVSSYVYRKGAAVLLEYLYSIKFDQNAAAFDGDKSSQAALFGPDGVVDVLSCHLGAVDLILLSSFRQLYNTQNRSWPLPGDDSQDHSSIKTPNTTLKLTSTHCKYMFPAGTITTPDDPSEVNAKDIFDWTPAHYAANRTRFGLPGGPLKSWTVEGADLSAADFRGWTPLHYACCNDDASIVGQLISKDADPNLEAVNGMTPVHCAALYGTVTTLDLLIPANARLDVKDIFGRAPIHLAAMGKWPVLRRAATSIPEMYTIWVNKIVSRLRDQLDARDKNGRTPLHLAAANGCHLTVDAVLRESHAQITFKDNQGRSPLHLAVLNRVEDRIIDSLLRGPVVDFKDNMGHTPIETAMEKRNVGALRKLIERGAVVNMPCHDWVKLLQWSKDGKDRDVDMFIREASDSELMRRMVGLKKHQDTAQPVPPTTGDDWESLRRWAVAAGNSDALSFIEEAGRSNLGRQIAERMQKKRD